MNNIDNKIQAYIYTDGSCNFKTKQGGWSFVIVIDDKEYYSLNGFASNTTNNRMELTAMIEALKHIQTNFDRNKYCFTIYSDSKYVVDGSNSWIDTWVSNKWTKKYKNKGWLEIINKDLWEHIFCLRCSATIKWVKGHSGHVWNSRADELCDYSLNKASVAK